MISASEQHKGKQLHYEEYNLLLEDEFHLGLIFLLGYEMGIHVVKASPALMEQPESVCSQ